MFGLKIYLLLGVIVYICVIIRTGRYFSPSKFLMQ